MRIWRINSWKDYLFAGICNSTNVTVHVKMLYDGWIAAIKYQNKTRVF